MLISQSLLILAAFLIYEVILGHSITSLFSEVKDMSVLEVNDFWWKYRSYVGVENPFTLKGLSFKVDKGEFFGIIGPSGAGKITFCYALTGVIPHVFTVPRGERGSTSRA